MAKNKFGLQLRVKDGWLHAQFTGPAGNRDYGFSTQLANTKLVKAVAAAKATLPSLAGTEQVYVKAKVVGLVKGRLVVAFKQINYTIDKIEPELRQWLKS